MSERPSAVFLFQLVQDVSVLRPLVFMAARDFGFETLLLVSTKFLARDEFGIWSTELDEIAAGAGCRLDYFDDDWEAHCQLTARGLLFSASESHLPNHGTTHGVFRHAPATYLKVTVQHGFECVGFRHSSEHDRAHGTTASFAADIVCAWSGSQLSSLAPSQRGKLLVTGPTSVLQLPEAPAGPGPDAPGLVCENLHSVRFGAAQTRTSKSEFVDAFERFARRMADQDKQIALRPHTGGQYYIRNRLALPPSVTIENAPLYRIDLSRFAYGISAPSSVLIDMLLADLPTALWTDRAGEIDASAYRGLPTVSSVDDWIDFARTAEGDRGRLLADQRAFLDAQGMVLDPKEVFTRFARLFEAAERMEDRGSVPPARG